MPSHREDRFLPFAPGQLFDLVADVGAYPEFLPWVAATRIRERSETLMVADMSVGFRAIRETFTSRVTLDRPRAIHVDYVSGPLKHLSNDWMFEPEGQGTRVRFAVDFSFRSRLFERLAGAVFHEAFRHMVAAFEARARKLYGSALTGAAAAAQ
ncbi:type II toxin-antitoxin system RatA family toxin [Thermaurantiacus sp.]